MKIKPVTLIAEVGSNFDGDLDTAKKYVRLAKEAGADAVKFQTLIKSKIISHQTWTDGAVVHNPVFDIFKSLELPESWHFELKKVADEVGIAFASTPFYLEAVDFLEKVDVAFYKIASGDITFFPLIEAIGRKQRRVILSTGASTPEDIERALEMLRKGGTTDISILHCVSNYPPQWDEMNLRAIVTMRERHQVPVGISDHTPGITVPIASVALGGTLIEKHVTVDKTLPGPDHHFAITFGEFAEMATAVRNLEKALGDGIKRPAGDEVNRQTRIRRGLYNPETFEPLASGSGIWLRPHHTRPQ
ncbi:MAG: N-acetylneuraminate synthase family protein [Spirochaetia bacterium]|nr:N-acetylneuraminate synthase family protein [Spirochaetia bacterium]